MGHTMRLGSYPADLLEDSLVAELYGTTHVTERHRHRYEVNVGVELGGTGVGDAQHVAGVFDDHGLQAQAQAERRDAVLAGVAQGADLAVDASDAEAVVNCVDANSIYDVPKVLFDEGLDAYVVRELGLPFHDVDWDEWEDLLERVHHPKHEVTHPARCRAGAASSPNAGSASS